MLYLLCSRYRILPRLPSSTGLPIHYGRPVPSGTEPQLAGPGPVAACRLETVVTGVSESAPRTDARTRVQRPDNRLVYEVFPKERTVRVLRLWIRQE